MIELKGPYLDTSAVRSLGRQLGYITTNNVTVSALALVELVTAAARNERSFSKVRPGLSTLLASTNVSILWQLPEERLANAFGWVTRNAKFIEERIESLRTITKMVVGEATHAKLRGRERSARLKFPLSYWVNYDTTFGRDYIEATHAGHKDLRDRCEKAKRGEAKIAIFREETPTMTYQEFCMRFASEYPVLNRSITVMGLAIRLASSHAMPAHLDSIASLIYGSYNGSIDPFIDAFSWRAMMDHKDSRRPSRNDALDLAHFAYLGHSSTLVTADEAMRETAIAIGLSVLPPASLVLPSSRNPPFST